ncbi:PilZ domain-containing protein [Qipengyuania sp. NPDC077563]|uniref:PilZ domain-containing protein n=1 Tax=Qipengyuania sp. NPDC077563 TaxID=3364497 RepID=UPI00384B816E
MSIWHTKLGEQADEGRAERIILKKRRKQNPTATGLGAVAIARTGSRAGLQRNDDRSALKERPVRALHQGAHFDATLLDMSANGIMITGQIPAARGDQISLTNGDAPPIAAFVRWMRDGRIGLEFCGHTELAAAEETCEAVLTSVLPGPLVDKNNQADASTLPLPRQANGRARLVWIGKLTCEGRSVTVRLRTISEGGAVLSLAAPLGVSDGAKVALELRYSKRMTGKVDWCAAQELHLRFDKAIDISALRDEPCAEIVAQNPAALDHLRNHEDQTDLDHLNIRALRIGHWQPACEEPHRAVSLDELHELLAADGRPSAA